MKNAVELVCNVCACVCVKWSGWLVAWCGVHLKFSFIIMISMQDYFSCSIDNDNSNDNGNDIDVAVVVAECSDNMAKTMINWCGQRH